MSSSSNAPQNLPSTPPPNQWIVTTCRDRLEHLSEALDTWLRWLPKWQPVVVCCDDEPAAQYAGQLLASIGRGIVLAVSQGAHFNKLEALRTASTFLEGTQHQARTVYLSEAARLATFQGPGRVALLDADTIATHRTAAALDAVEAHQFAIAGGRLIHDCGLLVAAEDVFAYAVGQLEPNEIVGYGHEDIALRVGCWCATEGQMVRLPVGAWSRRNHSDLLRNRFNTHQSIKASARANSLALQAFTHRMLPNAEERHRCEADCYPWAQRAVAAS
jgi:hypothetical protein